MGKYTRVFPVKRDNVEMNASPLTCGQTDEFLTKQEEILKEPEAKERVKKLLKLNYEFVASGLNNAGEEKWTGERIHAELDKKMVEALKDKIMEESGLVSPEKVAPGIA